MPTIAELTQISAIGGALQYRDHNGNAVRNGAGCFATILPWERAAHLVVGNDLRKHGIDMRAIVFFNQACGYVATVGATALFYTVILVDATEDRRLRNIPLLYALGVCEFQAVVILDPSALPLRNVAELATVSCPSVACQGGNDFIRRRDRTAQRARWDCGGAAISPTTSTLALKESSSMCGQLYRRCSWRPLSRMHT